MSMIVYKPQSISLKNIQFYMCNISIGNYMIASLQVNKAVGASVKVESILMVSTKKIGNYSSTISAKL